MVLPLLMLIVEERSPAFVQQSTGYRKYRRFEKAVAVKN